MSQKLYGSINLTKLMEKAKEGHSAFRKADNGNIYCQITEWINDEKDAKGNDASLLLSSKAEKKAEEGKVYIGNLKISERAEDKPVTAATVAADLGSLDDLPF